LAIVDLTFAFGLSGIKNLSENEQAVPVAERGRVDGMLIAQLWSLLALLQIALRIAMSGEG
jgi:hypothetical protein